MFDPLLPCSAVVLQRCPRAYSCCLRLQETLANRNALLEKFLAMQQQQQQVRLIEEDLNHMAYTAFMALRPCSQTALTVRNIFVWPLQGLCSAAQTMLELLNSSSHVLLSLWLSTLTAVSLAGGQHEHRGGREGGLVAGRPHQAADRGDDAPERGADLHRAAGHAAAADPRAGVHDWRGPGLGLGTSINRIGQHAMHSV